MSNWKFRIWGEDDDTVFVDGYKGIVEFTAIGDPWAGSFALFNEEEAGSGMRVHVIFDGCWSFAVAPVDPMVDMPLWPHHLERGSGRAPDYSMVLVIDTPAYTNLVWEPDEWECECDHEHG